MTANSPGKINTVIIDGLQSINEERILNTINGLRDSGSHLYITALADLLVTTQFEAVKKSVLELLGELKNSKTVPVMIEVIENEKYQNIRKELMAACWQNGLDFSGYLAKWVNWVIDSEMEIAFEAFTVIENLDFFPAIEICESELLKINRAMKTASGNKLYLLQELLTILNSWNK